MPNSDDVNKPSSASELYKKNVAARKKAGIALLEESDPLPDEVVDEDDHLHPFEVAVFSINVELRPELYEAMQWYLGAIALINYNDYYNFRNEERIRLPEYAQTEDDNSTMYFDSNNCVNFMHKVVGLPLGQCNAWVLKYDATVHRHTAHEPFAFDFKTDNDIGEHGNIRSEAFDEDSMP